MKDQIECAIQVLRQVEAGDGVFVGQCADAIECLESLLANPSDKQEAVNLQVFAEKVRNGIADYIADNMPDKKHSLAEIDLYVRRIEISAGMIAAPLAQSAEQDRIDAERYRRARDADYIVDSTERAIDNWIKGASK